MAACLLILFWLIDEFSFDKFNENYHSTYRVIHEQKYNEQVIHSSKAPVPLGPSLVEDFPEIINYTRYGTFVGEVLIKHEENAFYELGGAYVDPSYFNIFSIDFLRGNKEEIFPDRFCVVITESTAHRYFGDEDPMGKSLELENICQLKVTGIIKDIPENSHLQFDFAVPFTLYEAWGADLSLWNNWAAYTYVLLNSNASITLVNEKISNYLHDKISDNIDRLYLQPLGKIHLYSHFAYDSPAILGDINTVYIYSLIGFFILMIACINFINLTTAGSLKRAREIGLRKVVGAGRSHLIKQFIGETIVLTIIAFILSLVMIEMTMPYFNKLTGKNIIINFNNINIIAGTVLIIAFTGLFSGLYPAFFLSSFKPVKILKGTIKFGPKSAFLRKGLIVFQFFLSVTLVICTLVVFKQLSFIQDKELGFNADNVVYIQSRPGMYQDYPRFKENLLSYSNIIDVSATGEERGPISLAAGSISWQGKDPIYNPNFSLSEVDFDFFKTLQIKLVKGRSFSRELASDSAAVMVNKAAVKAMGMQDPVGQQVILLGKHYTIIGVSQDVHQNSLHTRIDPVVTRIYTYLPFSLYIRVSSVDLPATMKIIEEEWYKIVPDFPFVYNFLDERITSLYRYEQEIAKVFTYFAILAIFISCLGLFGLATFTAESRTKEIGVRKILGSSAKEIMFLLSRDFAKWVFMGNLIAWPVAWFSMKKWLQTFAYRTDIYIWNFLFAGLITIVIAFFAISFQMIRAANSNPVDALKYE